MPSKTSFDVFEMERSALRDRSCPPSPSMTDLNIFVLKASELGSNETSHRGRAASATKLWGGALDTKLSASHIPFITSTWIDGQRMAPNNLGTQPKTGLTDTVYYSGQTALINNLLQTTNVHVLVSDEDPNIIISWICWEIIDEVPVIHYLYTKRVFQKLGYAKQLLQHLNLLRPSFFTQQPPMIFNKENQQIMRTWRQKKADEIGWIYNPYILFSGNKSTKNAQETLHDKENQTNSATKGSTNE